MKTRLASLVIVSIMTGALVQAVPRVSAGELPDAARVEPHKVVETGDYSEGVVVDHGGNLYFSHDGIVTKVTPDGKSSLWARTGNPNGHKILGDGTHLICDAGRHAILHLDANGRDLEPAATISDGKPLRGPNDICLDPANHGVYFTDPASSSDKNPDGSIHYIDSAGVCHTVASGFAYPNGIVLRPDGKELLVGESKQNRILAFPVLSPGKVGHYRVLVNLPVKGPGQVDNQPDGITLDAAGNLYVAHYGMRQVQVVSPSGEVIRRYPGGNLTTSNVAFAGPNMDTLYVTGGDPGALFRLDLPGVKGLTILPPRLLPRARAQSSK
jgi:gluconolactonase